MGFFNVKLSNTNGNDFVKPLQDPNLQTHIKQNEKELGIIHLRLFMFFTMKRARNTYGDMMQCIKVWNPWKICWQLSRDHQQHHDGASPVSKQCKANNWMGMLNVRLCSCLLIFSYASHRNEIWARMKNAASNPNNQNVSWVFLIARLVIKLFFKSHKSATRLLFVAKCQNLIKHCNIFT